MRIINITYHISKLPLKEPFTTALRSVDTIDEIIVRIETTEDHGIGSAPATLAVTGDTLDSIALDIENSVIPAFINHTLDNYHQTFAKLSHLDICHSAQAAVDIALHDIFAKKEQKPLYDYLGGAPRNLQTLYTISINTPDKMLLQAEKTLDEGFNKLKIKLDSNLEENLKRVKRIATQLPPAELYLDINQAFTFIQAKAFITTLHDSAIVLLEQPLKADDFEGMKALTLFSDIPILADETVFTYADALRAIKEGACDYINIKLMKCGGIYEARKILDLCQKHDIKCMMGSMLESGISVTAALHLAYAYKNVLFADLDGPTLAKKSIINGGIHYDTMSIFLNKASGLGINF